MVIATTKTKNNQKTKNRLIQNLEISRMGEIL